MLKSKFNSKLIYFFCLFFFVRCNNAHQFNFGESSTDGVLNVSAGKSAGAENEITVAKLEFNQNDFTVTAGSRASLSLKVTLSNDKVYNRITKNLSTPYGLITQVVWSSSNENVISIDDSGTLTAVGVGNANITASVNGLSQKISVSSTRVSPSPQTQTDDKDEDIITEDEGSESDSTTTTETLVPEPANDPDDYYLGDNDTVTLSVGDKATYGQSAFPENVYGLPVSSRTDVISLGNGGSLIIELNGYVIVNGDGADFIVFENPFSGWTERAQISVSEDGITYTDFPCDAFDPAEVYDHCAGVSEVNYSSSADDMRDPNLSGGDVFDLDEVSVSRVKFIKITDMNTCTSAICTTSAGFDLDAFAIVNGVNE